MIFVKFLSIFWFVILINCAVGFEYLPPIRYYATNSDYETIPSECVVDKTGENGIHKLLEHCPWMQKEIENGYKPQTICDKDFCNDLVCCPIEKNSNRKNKLCRDYDDPFHIIKTRLAHFNYTCVTEGTIGVIIDESFCKIKSNDKVCKFSFCEGFVCCTELKRKDQCTRKYDSYIKFVGDSCKDKSTGRPGTCRVNNQCPELWRNTPDNVTWCGYDCCTPVVCCPEKDSSQFRTSETKCHQFSEAIFTKTQPFGKQLRAEQINPEDCSGSPFYALGTPALPGQFPSMAAVGYGNEGTIEWKCGGTLISDEFVMTAAHCLQSPELGAAKYVLLGATSLEFQAANSDCPEEYKISERISHPQYNSSLRYNDIALLRLNGHVTFNPYIRPACLPTESLVPDYLTAMGWGATSYATAGSNALLEVQLSSFTHTECTHFLKNVEFKLNLGIVEETQLCSGSRNDGRSACGGDSGGPLQGRHNNLYNMVTVYGITSFGRACGFKDSPSVYTKVYPYIPWIESVVWS